MTIMKWCGQLVYPTKLLKFYIGEQTKEAARLSVLKIKMTVCCLQWKRVNNEIYLCDDINRYVYYLHCKNTNELIPNNHIFPFLQNLSSLVLRVKISTVPVESHTNWNHIGREKTHTKSSTGFIPTFQSHIQLDVNSVKMPPNGPIW